ncbi:MAG: hypothetical protein PHY28_05090 [Dehalococcoidales bacterium]|nr:hypothetical protein [Dehalococcoidales bacterium]
MVVDLDDLKTPRSHKSMGFYSLAEASRISVVPHWTLDNWKRNGIIIPTVKWIDESQKEHFGYTFETVVFIRLLRLLREKNISLFNAVKAAQQLKRRFGIPSKKWANAKIFTEKNDVYVYEEKDRDTWGITVATRYNQKVSEVILGNEFIQLKDRADALLIPQQYMKFVEIDPTIQNGLPIVLGTKILTKNIHDLTSQDYKPLDINRMYPFIPEDKIIGAEEYETFLDRLNSNLN